MKFIQNILFYLLIIFSLPSQGQSAVSYNLNGGRFGDNIASFVRALWVSYKYQIPLLYIKFPYSEQLYLNENPNFIKNNEPHSFKSTHVIKDLAQEKIELNNDLLYICEWGSKIKVDFTDKDFMILFKQNVSPTISDFSIYLDNNRFNVAVHVRKGGNFLPDNDAKLKQPLRFPPDEFYIEQIKKIAEIVKQPLHVYIFTDDLQPDSLAKKFSAMCSDLNVSFSYKSSTAEEHVVQDFFAMTKFDALVRPESHFSIWCQRLGNHKIVISPASVKISDGKIVIDKVNIKINYPK